MVWVFALMGGLLGFLSLILFERIPAGWLCDFGETPSEIHRGERLSGGYRFSVIPLLALFCPLIYLEQANFLRASLLCLPLFFSLLCALSDIRYKIIPTQFCILIALLSFFSLRSFGISAVLRALCGGLILGGVFLFIGLLGSVAYKKQALGFGDVYFAAALGLYFEHFYSLFVFAAAILSAGVYFAILVLLRKFTRHSYAPLGPFIAFGFCLSQAFEHTMQAVVRWYSQLLLIQ